MASTWPLIGQEPGPSSALLAYFDVRNSGDVNRIAELPLMSMYRLENGKIAEDGPSATTSWFWSALTFS